MVKNCQVCNKEFYAKPSHVAKGYGRFCNKLCFDNWQRLQPKGELHHRYNSTKSNCPICGTTVSESPSRRKDGRGKYCSKACYTKGMVGVGKGRKMSKETHDKISGKNHYNWKGGMNYEYRMRMKTPEWEVLKREIYKRDNFHCQKCQKICRGRDISCHHITPWRITHDDSYGNLMTLCRSCHAKEG